MSDEAPAAHCPATQESLSHWEEGVCYKTHCECRHPWSAHETQGTKSLRLAAHLHATHPTCRTLEYELRVGLEDVRREMRDLKAQLRAEMQKQWYVDGQ
jgi:hypothetical protein